MHAAQTDLQGQVLEWLKRHDLTTVEELATLQYVLGGTISGTLRAIIRAEREGHDHELQESEEKEDSGRHRRD